MIYIVTMYRYGSKESHSYVLGVFDDVDIAGEEANKNKVQRGNKYEPEIVGFELNDTTSKIVVVPLTK